MSSRPTLTVTYFGRVALIQFIRPRQMNSFTPAQYTDILATFKELAANDRVHCVILTGSGPMYSSGHDLNGTHRTPHYRTYISPRILSVSPCTPHPSLACFYPRLTFVVSFFNAVAPGAPTASADGSAPVRSVGLPMEMIHAFIDFPKPLITAVNGGCVGVAATMTQLGDATLVADDAWFETPFVPLGLCAEGCASLTFPRALGIGRASEMLYAGARLTAQDAAATGFALRAVPRNALLPEALALATRIAAMSLDSLVTTKRNLRDLDREALHALADKEGTQFARRLKEDDFARALDQFKNRKNKPAQAKPEAKL